MGFIVYKGQGKSVARSFVFHVSAIATLKVQATSSCVQHPTRVEVVSAFIWKHAKVAYREKKWFPKAFLIDPFSGSASTALAEVFFWKSPLDGSSSVHGQ